jgi:branched-chain amino acid transport system permease protein
LSYAKYVGYFKSNMEFSTTTAVFVLLLLTLPFTFPIYVYRYLVIALMFAAMASSWNILGGYAGYLSFGHMSFFGIGAYTSAILITAYRVSPFITVPLGALLAAGVMLVALYSFIRLEEAYFAIATLAFNFALFYLALVLPQTNGSEGIFRSMVSGGALGLNKLFFAVITAVVIGILVVSHLVQKSKLGKELVAMREDKPAAESLGVNTLRAKLKAGLISAGATGLVGAFYPVYITYIDPGTAFNIDWSILLVVMVVFGGIGTLAGPIMGAFAFESIRELFTYFVPIPQLSTVFIGGALVTLLLVLPNGVYGTVRKKYMAGKKIGNP